MIELIDIYKNGILTHINDTDYVGMELFKDNINMHALYRTSAYLDRAFFCCVFDFYHD